jgi:gluconate kinase
MKKIGPYLSVPNKYVPRMQDAIDADTENGVQWLNQINSKQLNEVAPTVLAMAFLIEEERDKLKKELKKLLRNLNS